MTYSFPLTKVRSALLATAAVAGLAMAPAAAHASSYGLSAVDVNNVIFSGINAFSPSSSFNFETTSAATLTGHSGAANDSGPDSTAADGVNITATRSSSGSVGSLADIGFAHTLASAIPTIGNIPNFSTAQGSIANTSANAAGVGFTGLGASWRGSAEAALTGKGSASANGQESLTWNLTNTPTANLTLNFDISLDQIATVSGSGGTAKSFYSLTLTFVGTPGISATDVTQTILNTSTPPFGGDQSATYSSACTETPNGGETHVSCTFDGIGGSGQVTLTSVESVQLTSIPEPTTIGMLGMGLLGLGAAARRRSSQKKVA